MCIVICRLNNLASRFQAVQDNFSEKLRYGAKVNLKKSYRNIIIISAIKFKDIVDKNKSNLTVIKNPYFVNLCEFTETYN